MDGEEITTNKKPRFEVKKLPRKLRKKGLESICRSALINVLPEFLDTKERPKLFNLNKYLRMKCKNSKIENHIQKNESFMRNNQVCSNKDNNTLSSVPPNFDNALGERFCTYKDLCIKCYGNFTKCYDCLDSFCSASTFLLYECDDCKINFCFNCLNYNYGPQVKCNICQKLNPPIRLDFLT